MEACEGDMTETVDCEDYPAECPVPSKWTSWYEWSDCSATCGESTRTRARDCIKGTNMEVCEGDKTETVDCDDIPAECPVPSEWTTWYEWSECSATCGESTRTRARDCVPGTNMEVCEGDMTETVDCEDIPAECPIPSVWSSWYEWSECSATCGESTRTRARDCIKGTNMEICEGDKTETVDCEDIPAECPVPSEWTTWYEWSECSATCGESTRTRARDCVPGTNMEVCEGDMTETVDCEDIPAECPVPSVWSSWYEWSDCSATCGESTRTRARDCIFGTNMEACEGDIIETADCEDIPESCPTEPYVAATTTTAAPTTTKAYKPPAYWSAWSAWSECPVTCGQAFVERSRTCVGSDSGCAGASMETDICVAAEPVCTTTTVPAPTTTTATPTWADWSEWSECDNSCGGGVTMRSRVCSVEGYCTGEDSQSAGCNLQACDPVYRPPCGCSGNANFCDVSAEGFDQCDSDSRCERVLDAYGNVSGNFECVPTGLNKCVTKGDPHITTFDGAQHDLYGQGLYIQSEPLEGAKVPYFQSAVQTGPYAKKATVSQADGHELRFDGQNGDAILIRTTRQGTCEMTRCGIGCETLDCTDGGDDFSFERFPGRKMKIVTWTGIELEHTKGIINLCLPAIYIEQVKGVCGSFDRDIKTDYQNPDGTPRPCSATVKQGGKRTQCEYDTACGFQINGNMDCNNCGEGEDCGVNPTIPSTTSCADECAALFFNPALEQCHFLVDPRPFISECEVDLCMSDSDSKESMKSELVEAYASSCIPKCDPEPTPELCSYKDALSLDSGCGENEVYKACGRPCADNDYCEAKECSATEAQSPGCYCAEGFFLSDGACVAECPVPSEWETWGEWTDCSATCGPSTRSRNRNCILGSAMEDCVGDSTETEDCSDIPEVCPYWAQWFEWSGCSATCGDSERTRERICNGGIGCIGDDIETEVCLAPAKCPGPMVCNEWSQWTECSETCGGGTRMRGQECSNGVATTSADAVDYCNSQVCPVKPSNECLCPAGLMSCASNQCDESESCDMLKNGAFGCVGKDVGVCRSVGDPHITTFDGPKIDHYLSGRAILVNSLSSDLPPCSIHIETTPFHKNPKFSKTEKAFTTFISRNGKTEYTIETSLEGPAFVSIDGGASQSLFDQENADFTFKRLSKASVKLTTFFGLELTHERMKVGVRLPSAYQESLTGLCGNFNSDDTDDYLNPDGGSRDCEMDATFKMSECEKDTICGFMISGDCTDPVDPPVECHAECEALYDADWLKPCTDKINPEQFIADCKVDLCVADSELLDEIKKDLISDYVSQCKSKVDPEEPAVCDWMTLAGFEPSCPANMEFKGCAKECSETLSCSEKRSKKKCPRNEGVFSGCVCKKGYFLLNGDCVDMTSCFTTPYGKPGVWTAWSSCR